jgi:thymidylate synthase
MDSSIGSSLVIATREPINIDELKAKINEWIELDIEMQELRKVMKKKAALKKPISEWLMFHMDKHNVGDVKTKDGKLVLKTSTINASISIKAIKAQLEESKLSLSIDDMIHRIFDNRPQVNRASLKFSKHR